MSALLLIVTTLWIGAEVYLWSLTQSQVTLFWESLGMAAIAFPALGWYVTRK